VATVDGQGNVQTVDSGEAIITATLVSVNKGPMNEALSVEIPVRVVKQEETDSAVTAQVMLDRSLQRTTTLENGKPYVISSTLTDNWVLTNRFKASDCDTSYTGPVLEHFDLSGGEDVWYYVEETVDGVTKQHLRYGSLEVENNYLRCLNRVASMGALGSHGFDSIVLNETHGAFKIIYTAYARHLHQLGGPSYDTAIPTSQYVNDLGSFWYFNTIIPGGQLKLTVDKAADGVHLGQPQQLSYSLTLDGAAVTDYQLQWTTSAGNIAAVNNGAVTGLAAGDAVIAATVT
jgi:hypothetical protein